MFVMLFIFNFFVLNFISFAIGTAYAEPVPTDSTIIQGDTLVTSGLGGMSGAQGKATVIAKGVGIIAEGKLLDVKTIGDMTRSIVADISAVPGVLYCFNICLLR